MHRQVGLHAPELEAVRALRTKAGRAERGRFAIEGTTMLGEALAAGCEPEAVYATEAGLAALAAAGWGGAVGVVPERAMARLSELESPPGVLAVLRRRLDEPEALLEGGEPVLVLAGVGDPGNAGTLLRTAEIFGIGGAIFADGAVEPHNGKVVRATMGAIFRLRLALTDDAGALARAHGYTVVAGVLGGVPLPRARFPARAMIAVGNERRGIDPALAALGLGVTIPQRGSGQSLNAAVAGGILLYAFAQARDSAP